MGTLFSLSLACDCGRVQAKVKFRWEPEVGEVAAKTMDEVRSGAARAADKIGRKFCVFVFNEGERTLAMALDNVAKHNRVLTKAAHIAAAELSGRRGSRVRVARAGRGRG